MRRQESIRKCHLLHERACSVTANPSRRRKPAVLLILVAPHLFAAAAWAEDTVWLRSSGPSDRIYARRGTIADYTGQTLTLAPDTRIPADRVVRIDSKWTASQLAGDAAIAEGEFAKALAAYQRAMREESRRWVRRRILAQMVWCYRGQGKSDQAALAFLSLVKDDPATRAFDAIPLVWFASTGVRVDAAKARGWLKSPDAAARLIGASHLMASPDRRAALDVLEALSIVADRRIALLAQAQLWRVRTAQSKPHEVDGWAGAIQRIPESLRAGPYFVVARAFAHHKQPKRAAETYMRVPILHRNHYHLAAQSLWDAARQLESLGNKAHAKRLYRELVRDFHRAPTAELARRRLEESEKPPATP